MILVPNSKRALLNSIGNTAMLEYCLLGCYLFSNMNVLWINPSADGMVSKYVGVKLRRLLAGVSEVTLITVIFLCVIASRK